LPIVFVWQGWDVVVVWFELVVKQGVGIPTKYLSHGWIGGPKIVVSRQVKLRGMFRR